MFDAGRTNLFSILLENHRARVERNDLHGEEASLERRLSHNLLDSSS